MSTLTRIGLAAAAVALGLLSGCETTPTVVSQTARNVNLAAYRTYGYMANPNTDESGYTTINTRVIREAIDREMQARGYVPGTSPDLLVNFHVSTRDKVEGHSYGYPGVGVGYGGWRNGYGYGVGWGMGDIDIHTYTEGSLTVDVVDAARNELIWTGSAVGRVTTAVAKDPEPAIHKAVTLIFGKYPRPPGPAAPTAPAPATSPPV